MKRREVLAAGLLGGIGAGTGGALTQGQTNVRFLTPETDPSQVRVWQDPISHYVEANRGTTIRPGYASWGHLIRKVPATSSRARRRRSSPAPAASASWRRRCADTEARASPTHAWCFAWPS